MEQICILKLTSEKSLVDNNFYRDIKFGQPYKRIAERSIKEILLTVCTWRILFIEFYLNGVKK